MRRAGRTTQEHEQPEAGRSTGASLQLMPLTPLAAAGGAWVALLHINAHQCSPVPTSAHQCPPVPTSAHWCPPAYVAGGGSTGAQLLEATNARALHARTCHSCQPCMRSCSTGSAKSMCIVVPPASAAAWPLRAGNGWRRVASLPRSRPWRGRR